MEEIIIQLKDHSKRGFLLELLAQYDFIELYEKKKGSEDAGKASYDFFQSAGLFKERDIDADQLRRSAWKRKS